MRKLGFLFSNDQRHRPARPQTRTETERPSVSPPFRISPARTNEEVKAVAELFAAYAAALPTDLHYQDFSNELANLPGKYVPPEGELLVACFQSTGAARVEHARRVVHVPLASGPATAQQRCPLDVVIWRQHHGIFAH